jgi:Arc/MetJ family transcription regulator
MRTNVVIDDNLMKAALDSSGLKTKKDAIEAGLKLLVRFNRQAKIKNFRGKLKWIGNLNEMRMDIGNQKRNELQIVKKEGNYCPKDHRCNNWYFLHSS